MSVDIRGIEVALVRVVRDTIGDQLSTLGTGIHEKPSVIRSRTYADSGEGTTPTFPDYPYASVDYTRITDEGYELTERYFDENDNYVYRTHKLASYSIKVFGTSKDDVTQISDTMHMMFETDQTRASLTSRAPNQARVRSKSDVVFVASNMQDKYREVASFDVILAVLDEVSIPAGGTEIIENIHIDTSVPQEGIQGGIYRDDEDIDPLNIDVETQVTYP